MTPESVYPLSATLQAAACYSLPEAARQLGCPPAALQRLCRRLNYPAQLFEAALPISLWEFSSEELTVLADMQHRLAQGARLGDLAQRLGSLQLNSLALQKTPQQFLSQQSLGGQNPPALPLLLQQPSPLQPALPFLQTPLQQVAAAALQQYQQVQQQTLKQGGQSDAASAFSQLSQQLSLQPQSPRFPLAAGEQTGFNGDKKRLPSWAKRQPKAFTAYQAPFVSS